MLTPEQVTCLVQDKKSYLEHNYKLIDIFENNLLPYIDNDMRQQFSLQMYTQAMLRCVPINILPKIIDKLTNIYSKAVIRQVVDGSTKDKELLAWYQQTLNVNNVMNSSNEMFNLCKATLIQPYLYKGKPCLRPILNDKFIVYSDDKMNPTVPTYVIILAGCENNKEIYWTYSDDEFMISNSNNEIERGMMAEYLNEDGINPIGKIPYIYVNSSKYRLNPKQDQDVIKLTKIVPVMLTDLNVAAMYQAFSIMYGIDIDDENIAMSPNAFWRFKSDPTSDKKPELGVMKAQVDYNEVLNLIQSELTMWLSTKGVRASSVGTFTQENFASGISKIIDEMDTYEARQKQIPFYEQAEHDLWDLILKRMNPYWVHTRQIDSKALFDPNAFVQTTFATQLPLQTRGEIVKEVKEEYQSGFNTRKGSIQRLNPEMSDEAIEELIKEIDEERGITVEETADGQIIEGDMAQISGSDQTLNGAQVASLVALIERVQTGVLPKDSAKVIIKASFKLDDVTVNGIVDPIIPNSVAPTDLLQTSGARGPRF